MSELIVTGIAYDDRALNPGTQRYPRAPSLITGATVPLIASQPGGNLRLGDATIERDDHTVRATLAVPDRDRPRWEDLASKVPLMACQFGHSGLLSHLVCVMLVPEMMGRTDHLQRWTIGPEGAPIVAGRQP